MKRLFVNVSIAVIALALASGCAASYEERMKFLDKMSAEGISYRGQLQQQQTNPDQGACEIGWGLLQPGIPSDLDGGGASPEWVEQAKEAYLKSCMTGETIPKPDVSGVNARTVVPFTGSPSPAA